jgi:serine protease Do
MSSERTTRRRYLGAFGATLAASLAGCSGVLSQSSTNNSSTTSGTETAAGNATNATNATSTNQSSSSPYTQVYRNTISSVVLIRVSAQSGRGRQSRGGGQGSGFLLRQNYIVTNAHVVGDASEVQVRFSKGQWRTASVVGTDPSSDLAVVQVQNPPQYAGALSLVESEPAIGTEAVAIGNPFGLEGSVTSGLISGLNRLIPAPNGYRIPDAIQTGAPVNPGNSGGPLVDLNGRVIGVISSGGGENLAFAISAALVKRVVPALIENGEYDHAYLGIAPQTVTPDIAERLGLDQPRGVVVARVRPNGPSAGTLQQGDVILSINGMRIDGRQQLISYLALQASPGDTVEMTILRNGERRTVSLTLGTRPERPGAFGRMPQSG